MHQHLHVHSKLASSIAWLISYKSHDTVGATPLVDSGWHNLLMWAQKLQCGRLTHFVQTNLLLCRKNPNIYFVVSPILSDTLCWFGSNNESTICTINQFCWCGWLFLKSTFLMVNKFCWFVVDTESTIFVNWPDLTKSTDRLTFTQINLLDG
mgnify:CR=1 FL=1